MSDVPWPHAPVHQLSSGGTFFVTASTYGKEHHFRGRSRLSVLHRGLLKVATEFGWRLEAWAVFSNHYHFAAHSPLDQDDAGSLAAMLGALHSKTAIWTNKRDGTLHRKVWHNYWESVLTFHRSYLARLNYVHQNPVRHGLTLTANQYPWCSAAWFERVASPAQVKSVYRFKVEQVKVEDDYQPEGEW